MFIGCGLNLFGHVMFLFEPYVNHALDDQVKSRIVRLGQTHTVVVYHLLFPCMDTELWHVKQEKLAKASFFIEDEKSSLGTVYDCSKTRIEALRQKVSKKPAITSDKEETMRQNVSKKCHALPNHTEKVSNENTDMREKEVIDKKALHILSKERPRIALVSPRNAFKKTSSTTIQQADLWFCQNENCATRTNRKPSLVCAACKTPKGLRVALVARKLKRKM